MACAETEETVGKLAGNARLQGDTGVEAEKSHRVLNFPTIQCLGRLFPQTRGKKMYILGSVSNQLSY